MTLKNSDNEKTDNRRVFKQTAIMVVLMLLSLPLFYYLFAKILLPVAWKEDTGLSLLQPLLPMFVV